MGRSRCLPSGVRAVIEKKSWLLPRLFEWLQREGNVAEDEMHRVFNCGIGMVVVVEEQDAARAMELLRIAGETVYRIGRIESHSGEADAILV